MADMKEIIARLNEEIKKDVAFQNNPDSAIVYNYAYDGILLTRNEARTIIDYIKEHEAKDEN